MFTQPGRSGTELATRRITMPGTQSQQVGWGSTGAYHHGVRLGGYCAKYVDRGHGGGEPDHKLQTDEELESGQEGGHSGDQELPNDEFDSGQDGGQEEGQDCDREEGKEAHTEA